MSIGRQCELLGLTRSSFYYEPATETAANLALMRLIDQRYTDRPFYGSRKMTIWLQGAGHEVNRKRVQRLMRLMGLEAVYPKPKLSAAGAGTQGLSVPAAGRDDRARGSGVEYGHHLCPSGVWLHVPGGGDRLVSAAM